MICQASNDPVIINEWKGWKSSLDICPITLPPAQPGPTQWNIEIFSSSTASVSTTRATRASVSTPASRSLWREETGPDFCRTSRTWRISLGRRRVSRAWQRSSTKPHWKISKKTTKAKSVLTRRLFPGVRSWKFPRQPAANWADLAPSPKLRYFVVTLCMTSPTLAGLNTFTPGINKWVLGSIIV